MRGICKAPYPVAYVAGMTPAANISQPTRPLTRNEAAEFLQIAPETLAKWATIPGKGPRYYRSAPRRGRVWYRLEDLEQFVSSRSVGGSQDSHT